MIYLRQLHKQKPQTYGPPSQVQSSTFANADRAGINPGSIALAMPMWGPGDQLVFGQKLLSASSDAAFNNNSLFYRSNTTVVPNYPAIDFEGATETNFTILFNWRHVSWSSLYDRVLHKPATDGTDGWQLVRAGDTVQFVIERANNQTRFEANADVPVDYTDYCYTYNRDLAIGSRVSFFENGTQKSITYQSSSSWGWGTTDDLIIAGRSGTTETRADFDMRQLLIFSCLLSYSQIAYLSDNPYFLLHRQPSVFYSVPSGEPATFNPAWARNCNNLISGSFANV